MPKISIILPTYNRARTLLRAVNSVISQTFRDWELIVIDDGSKDTTGKLMKPYVKKDPRIYYRFQKNIGEIPTRQIGISLAKAVIISFIDSDDYYKPTHLEKNFRYLQQHPEIDAVYGKTKTLGDLYVPDIRDNSKMIHVDKCHIYPTFFIRKKVFRTIKKLPAASLGADYLLYHLMRKHGFKIRKLSYCTYVYDRTAEDSWTKNYARSLALNSTKKT